MTPSSAYRLPRNVTPSSYELKLAPNLEQGTFSGTVKIHATILKPTTEIVLNALDLSIVSSEIITADGRKHLAEPTLDVNAERLTLLISTQLDIGPIEIELNYEGTLNDKLRGFYRSTFVDSDGLTRTIAATQFESTDARRAFPCWDEPDLKATFDVSLLVPENLLAISSAPEIERELVDGGLVQVRFGRTMRMSTYLLAFIVGPLVATNAVDVDGIPLRVIHVPGKDHLSEFPLEVGAFSLRHFTSYFEAEYPGQKLDLVALPDFASGAMENLGCITFREPLLMLDVEQATISEQRRSAEVIAHEIAHMWFGNLVTMTWWNGIWLKEAFATFCELQATDVMQPDWLQWENFGLSRSTAFNIDSLIATRPVEFNVVCPTDADAMYDALTYEKGAAVVRMLEQHLGEQKFRDGIRDYLREHAYGNTNTNDLWDSLERSTGQPVRQIMDSWIFQGGYPLVAIQRTSMTSVKLHQQRFSYSADAEPAQWSIPIVLATGNKGSPRTHHRLLLETVDRDVDLGMTFDWIVGNANANGFYRVKLTEDLQSAITNAPGQLTALERFSVVDDAWAAFLADQIPTTNLLSLVIATAEAEQDTSVWKRILSILTALDDQLKDSTQQNHRDLALNCIVSKLDEIGPEPTGGEAEQTSELRGLLFGAGGYLGERKIIDEARSLLKVPADPARTSAAIEVVAANGSAKDFEDLVALYENAKTPQEERRFLYALPLFKQPQEINAFLALLETEKIRTQDACYVLGRALGNDAASKQVWDYISRNWESIQTKYPDNSIPRMISGVQNIGHPEVAAAISNFFETHDLPQAGLTLPQHLERMWVTVRLRERLGREIR